MRWHRRSASSGRDGSPGTRRQGAEIPPGQCLGSTPREQGLMGRDARQGLLPEGANASPLRAVQPPPRPSPTRGEGERQGRSENLLSEAFFEGGYEIGQREPEL